MSRLKGLDGLRGVAALMVFVYHARWKAGNPALTIFEWNVTGALRVLDCGVAVFFVLSGFLLSLPYWQALAGNGSPPSFRRYLTHRAARILPAYWTAIIVMFIIAAPGSLNRFDWFSIAVHALALQTWFDFIYTAPPLPVLWSVGIEWQFYLLLPLGFALLGVIARRLRTGLIPTGLFAIALAWLIGKVASLLLARLPSHVPALVIPDADSVVVTHSVFYYLRYFAVGLLGAAVHTRLKQPIAPRLADGLCLGALLGLGLVCALAGEATWRETTAAGWPLNALLIGMLVTSLPHGRFFSEIMEHAFFRHAGRLSFGIYLWHVPVMSLIFGLIIPQGSARPGVQALAGAVMSGVVCWIVAELSYRVIELPAMRRGRQT